MTAKGIIRAIMGARGVTNAELASRLGISSQAAWDRVNGKDKNGKEKDLTMGLMGETVRVMDYKVVVMPRGAKTPADSYEVS